MTAKIRHYIKQHHQRLFSVVIILGLVYSVLAIKDNVQMIADAERRKAEIRQASISDYMDYEVQPQKIEYALGEPLTFVTTRTIVQRHPINWIDQLYCDKHDDYGYRLIATVEGDNISPELAESKDYIREWSGPLPENPRGTLVPAKCYLKSRITMLVETVPKVVDNKTSVFYIR